MRVIFLFLILFSANSDWLTDFDVAKQKAKSENKLILLYFSGSDWCPHCMKTKKEIFESDVFKNFAASHLVLLNADFPKKKKNQLREEQRNKNEALKKIYNPAGQVPVIVLLSINGDEIEKWNGKPEDCVGFVNQLKEYGLKYLKR